MDDGRLSYATYSELLDHGDDPDARVETFEQLKDINEIINEEGEV